LNYYLHPRFNLLVGLTGLVIVQLGGWMLWRKSRQPEAGTGSLTGAALLGIVALVGLVITPRPLDDNRLALTGTSGNSLNAGSVNRALADALLKQDWKNASSLDTTHWSLLDWSAALNDPQRAEKLLDRPVDLVGFVIHPAGNSTHYFMVARYVLVCCTADSNALRLPVVSNKTADLEEGQWVRVRGTLSQNASGTIAFLAASVETVPTPAQPYIYP
jgi:uncharacterized repeat protein (TIGR03943 family)